MTLFKLNNASNKDIENNTATTDATKTAIISIALTPAFGIAVFAIVESLFCPPTETVTPSVVGWSILGFSLSDGVVGVDGFSGSVGLLGSVGSVGVDDFNAIGVKMAFYRKLDNFSQMQVISGVSCLKDANFTVDQTNDNDIGCVVGTNEGGLGSTYDFETLIAAEGNAKGSAFKFPNTVYNAAGGYLSINTGIKGYGVTLTSGPNSGIHSIGYAMNVIKDGQEKAMLATGNDDNTAIIENLYKYFLQNIN